MSNIIEFYNNLDTINLIIFWGIIIVIILLLAFSIIVTNKNKKLKRLIEEKKQNNINEELPIIKEMLENKPKSIDDNLFQKNENKEITNSSGVEKKFIVEEHVMEYNKDIFSLSNIKRVSEIEKEYQEDLKNTIIDNKKISTKPYQKNVLREISSNQTSPIGIIKPVKKEINNAKELQESLHENKNQEIETPKYEDIKEIKKEENTTNKINEYEKQQEKKSIENPMFINLQYKEKIHTNGIKTNLNNSNQKKEQYLKEVSQKLWEAKELNDIKRTEYELMQEEDAIISYEELMRKKDSIKIVEEEDAVISINELINLKKKEEKLYNLTETEENESFIDELKKFRKDL